MPVEIQNVQKASPAHKAGLRGGMRLLSINGKEIRDGLDYEFYSAAAQLNIRAQKPDGEMLDIALQKEETQPLGCEFATYLIDRQHACRNNCVFCFIDQMPKGLRPSLYFKDDDERMSFLFGNYITLTNLTQREVDRIIEMRISPVNISVHTANPVLRAEMMKNRFAGEVLRFIPQLAKAGISLNFQLVLCPGINDGDELRYSLEWLSGFYPAVQSIAAVPVGLTKHRQGLTPLRPYTAAEAAAQLDIMLEYGERCLKKQGERIIYPSDEWFLLASRPIPPGEFYGDYPQLENGVGMWRLFRDEFLEELAAMPEDAPGASFDIATGELAAPLMREMVAKAKDKYPGMNVTVHTIRNDFFGHTITIAGLLTGQDIIRQLKGRLQTNTLLLPDCMLQAGGTLLLDDTTPADIAAALGVRVEAISTGGAALAAKLSGEEE